VVTKLLVESVNTALPAVRLGILTKSFRIILPVVFPPRVRGLLRRDWMVEELAVIDRPLLFVFADKEAIGLPFAIFEIENRADDVAAEPSRKSSLI